MKIAVVVSQFPAIAETFVLNQITGLIDRGHDIDIIALDGFGNLRNKYHKDIDRYRLIDHTIACDFSKISGKRIIRAFQIATPLLSHFLKDPSTALKIVKDKSTPLSIRMAEIRPLVHEKAYDLVHCQFGDLATRVLALRRYGLLTGKLVISMRGYDITGYVKDKGKKVYDTCFNEADLFLPNCEFFLNILANLGCPSNKIALLRSGICLTRFTYQPRPYAPPERMKILAVGRLVEKKGFEYIIRAMDKLLKKGQNISLSIVGDGPLKNDLEWLVKKLSLEDQISFLGEKATEEVAALLREHHVFIASSVMARSGEQDAALNTLKEAMATGVPVIATRHGGIPELIEDGVSGFLVTERDELAIAEKIEWLIGHPDRWQPMRAAGRSRVERDYDSEKLNDTLVSLYQSLFMENTKQPFFTNSILS